MKKKKNKLHIIILINFILFNIILLSFNIKLKKLLYIIKFIKI